MAEYLTLFIVRHLWINLLTYLFLSSLHSLSTVSGRVYCKLFKAVHRWQNPNPVRVGGTKQVSTSDGRRRRRNVSDAIVNRPSSEWHVGLEIEHQLTCLIYFGHVFDSLAEMINCIQQAVDKYNEMNRKINNK